jgi:hypothetical protein
MPTATTKIKLTCEEITEKMKRIMDEVTPGVYVDDMDMLEKFMKAQMRCGFLASFRVSSQHEWHWTSGTMRPARNECLHCLKIKEWYHD